MFLGVRVRSRATICTRECISGETGETGDIGGKVSSKAPCHCRVSFSVFFRFWFPSIESLILAGLRRRRGLFYLILIE